MLDSQKQILPLSEALKVYDDALRFAKKHNQYLAVHRALCLEDLYYLMRFGLNVPRLDREWLYYRCREVEAQPDGMLDLWARGHYKSTIITFGLTIQEVLKDPEITIGIFSHIRPIAKQFLRQIKEEFQKNDLLIATFPDVLFKDPHREAPKWSEDDGIVVRRKGNPKEATIEAYGLVEGQPTSKHFQLMVYDDCVTDAAVSSPEMIAKTKAAWELSLNLTSENPRIRYIGTRYAFGDLYNTIIERGAATPRLHPGTHNGAVDGDPVLLTREALEKKRREMGAYTFAAQILQNPVADDVAGFRNDWLMHYEEVNWRNMFVYILCDPANEKKRGSDYSVFWVIGLGADKNYYLLDGVRDRLSLPERWRTLLALHQKYSKYRPVKKVGYERYGMQADIDHFKDAMRREGYRFEITELGGSMPKKDRIRRLLPIFEDRRILLPETLMRNDYLGKPRDLITQFIKDEYETFPVGAHDDMLDCLARILDEPLKAVFPSSTSASSITGGFKPKRRSLVRLGETR